MCATLRARSKADSAYLVVPIPISGVVVTSHTALGRADTEVFVFCFAVSCTVVLKVSGTGRGVHDRRQTTRACLDATYARCSQGVISETWWSLVHKKAENAPRDAKDTPAVSRRFMLR